jgi:hypothetical protein
MKNIKLLAITLFCLCSGFTLHAQNVGSVNLATNTIVLAWNASLSPDVTNYMVYVGTASGTYTTSVCAGTNLTCTVSNLAPAVTYYFTATAQDKWGLESAYANEINYVVPRTKPLPPTVVRRFLTQ